MLITLKQAPLWVYPFAAQSARQFEVQSDTQQYGGGPGPPMKHVFLSVSNVGVSKLLLIPEPIQN